ncbi:MAG: ParB N-terminal domain-containing protein [Deltaproteobacteria bacterium]|nr:ParB N-terminal domain-containing protein [Deltaproteobacteria bacterium]
MAEEKIKLKIEYMPVDQLRPFAGNPRKITGEGLKKLERSIGEFGFINPVLAWRNGEVIEIVAGHQRLKAAQAKGEKEVPVIVLPFDDWKKAYAYNLADNRLQDESEWDYPLLKDLVVEIDTGELDIGVTGFDLDELNGIFNYHGVNEEDLEDSYIARHLKDSSEDFAVTFLFNKEHLELVKAGLKERGKPYFAERIVELFKGEARA